MCLIAKMQLLCMQCRGIGPHLVARGKSHGFSRVASIVYSNFPFVYLLLNYENIYWRANTFTDMTH